MCSVTQIISTDVLVVGLGPAGASAAAAAGRKDARVIAVDRKASPGVPVQCAEFVPMALGGETVALAECQPIFAMQTIVEDDPADLTEDFSGRMIDRARFDATLVAHAEAAGAMCRFGVFVERLSQDGLAMLSNGTSINSRVIVGADGPRSRVGIAIGCKNEQLVETRQITVPLKSPHDATDIFLSAEIPGGYAWLFPKGNVANLGLGVAPEHRSRLKPLLEALRRRLIAEERIGEGILGHTGGPIPVGGMNAAVGVLGTRTVLLAGDAAGLVNPVTGAGIPAAVISGRMAGEAAAAIVAGDVDAMSGYAEDLEDTFGVSIARALARRHELLGKFRFGATPGRDDLRRGWIAYPQYWAA